LINNFATIRKLPTAQLCDRHRDSRNPAGSIRRLVRGHPLRSDTVIIGGSNTALPVERCLI